MLGPTESAPSFSWLKHVQILQYRAFHETLRERKRPCNGRIIVRFAIFLIVVRTLGEIFRLRYVHGANFSVGTAIPYVGGALIAGCSCWVGVTLYFFRRYTLSAWIALATVAILLAYKIAVIGW
jgi:hypothetical protein